ncbi:MAG: YceI family protein, partial [Gemmatimonadetes bacterium]|nr:YceI family protein [Gemmatimonadota bacterium]
MTILSRSQHWGLSLAGPPALLLLALARPLAAQAPVPIDTVRSRLAFSVPFARGLGRFAGSFKDYDVAIRHDERDVSKSSVSVTVRAASIDTGSDLTNEQLRGPRFLAVDRYPVITFTGDHVRKWGEEYLVVGDLSIRGITRKVAIPFRIITAGATGGASRVLGASTRAPVQWQPFAGGSGWRRMALETML